MTAASPVTIRKIGIIGAGRIGCGIAHVCAVSGFDVYLADISTEALERAVSNLTDSLDHQVSKGKISEAIRTAALDRISTGTGPALFPGGFHDVMMFFDQISGVLTDALFS
jgi:3-hydroxybutyryl-CoA dehydrogenase